MTIFGTAARPVDVECRLSGGLPQTVIVGLPGRTVAEAKDRLRSAFATCQLAWPKRHITLNLLPADLPKNDSGLDLALAAAVLIATGQLPPSASAGLYLGEIGLDGRLQPVRGLLCKLIASGGRKPCYLPAEQLGLAKLVPGLELRPLNTLADLLNSRLQPVKSDRGSAWPAAETPADRPDLADIAGQYRAKRALEIAAAGQHHLFLLGPPGNGKTLLARSLAGLLPALNRQQLLEINQLYGLTDQAAQLVTASPVREPHHSIRPSGLLGSSQNPLPGELSLAHLGILILNELPEFARASLEALRQPLEDHQLTRRQTGYSANYPADCMVAATANPCACGFFGSERPCRCSPYEVSRYNRRISGPLLDRFDLFVTVSQPTDSPQPDTLETTDTVKCRVAAARQRQIDRSGCLNGRLTDSGLRRQIQLTTEARHLLTDAASRLGLSSRGVNRCLRVARTIADLAASDQTDVLHLAEALQFRPPALLNLTGAET